MKQNDTRKEMGSPLALVGMAALAVVLSSCAGEHAAAPAQEAAASPSVGGYVSEGATADGSAEVQSVRDGATPWDIRRPGLATALGNSVRSPMTRTSFRRAGTKPQGGVATIWYNDKTGIDAMTGGRPRAESGMQRAADGLVEWGLRSGGMTLRNYRSPNGHRMVAGKMGSPYTIVIKSHARSRLEVVVSVDGLDVMDGKQASTKQRGYIIRPEKTLEIKGWRINNHQEGRFLFSNVSESHANTSGKPTRNVGVIGLAVFTEKGIDPWNGYARDVGNTAQPFAESTMQRAN